MKNWLFFSLWLAFSGCWGKDTTQKGQLLLGAERIDVIVPKLAGKRVGMVVNHTSMVGSVHLVDTLLRRQVTIQTIFAPEHGFRGTADAGEVIRDGRDPKTQLPIVSLYGKNKKPTPEQIQNLDVIVFDIQDVGVRFYTYISTMFYVLQAAAEQGKEVIVLDRPNPNGHYVDGPVLEKGFESFVGIAPIPVVHGMTVAELANMFNQEGWLGVGKTAQLSVVPCLNYNRNQIFEPSIRPSPNLPSIQSIWLYPSLCFFEGTQISLGRGTPFPFQVYGGESTRYGSFQFTPQDTPGAMNPPLEGKLCYGADLRQVQARDLKFSLKYLLETFQKTPSPADYFLKTNHFNLLAGNAWLKEMILAGANEEAIRRAWTPGLEAFKQTRKKYLIYAE